MENLFLLLTGWQGMFQRPWPALVAEHEWYGQQRKVGVESFLFSTIEMEHGAFSAFPATCAMQVSTEIVFTNPQKIRNSAQDAKRFSRLMLSALIGTVTGKIEKPIADSVAPKGIPNGLSEIENPTGSGGGRNITPRKGLQYRGHQISKG